MHNKQSVGLISNAQRHGLAGKQFSKYIFFSEPNEAEHIIVLIVLVRVPDYAIHFSGQIHNFPEYLVHVEKMPQILTRVIYPWLLYLCIHGKTFV